MYARASNTYRKVAVESASKSRVLDELLLRLMRDCDEAAAAIDKGDISGRASAVDHALRIITELVAALDRKVAPELCTNLERLYDFAAERLVRANREQDAALAAEAKAVISPLRGAFKQAAEQDG